MEPNIWYKQTDENIFTGLNSTREGLSSEEAIQRFNKNGPNELNNKIGNTSSHRLISALKSTFFWMLMFISVIPVFIGVLIYSMILASIAIYDILGCFFQDLRKRQSSKKKATQPISSTLVYRDGKIASLPAERIVTGDVIKLVKGDKVMADARIIKSSEFKCLEHNLTGEQIPAEKKSGILLENSLPLRARNNMVYMGTEVVSGFAEAIVVTTALNTEIGRKQQIVIKEPNTMSGKVYIAISIAVRAFLFISLLFVIGMFFFK